MTTRSSSIPATHIGFAAGRHGDGVAYAAVPAQGREATLLRVTFRCRPLEALRGRDVAYAALQAVALALRQSGHQAIAFYVEDGAVAADLADRVPLPAALTIPYVRLRCTLNRFRQATVVARADRMTRDLTARAQAETTLDSAA